MKLSLPKVIRAEQKAIVYNVLRTSGGWQIQAFLPKHVLPSDRFAVLDWFHDYRSKVQEIHPFWITNFRFSEQVYFLDIVKVQDQKEGVGLAIDLVEQSQQLDLDLKYA